MHGDVLQFTECILRLMQRWRYDARTDTWRPINHPDLKLSLRDAALVISAAALWSLEAGRDAVAVEDRNAAATTNTQVR